MPIAFVDAPITVHKAQRRAQALSLAVVPLAQVCLLIASVSCSGGAEVLRSWRLHNKTGFALAVTAGPGSLFVGKRAAWRVVGRGSVSDGPDLNGAGGGGWGERCLEIRVGPPPLRSAAKGKKATLGPDPVNK